MSNWKQNRRREDPDAGWKAIVAALLPEAQTQCDVLVASWQGDYPELPSKVIYHEVVMPLMHARYGTAYDRTVSAASQMLTDQLYKPVLAARQKAQREAERAAEALVDTSRPVVATSVEGGKERVGALAVVKGRGGDPDQVLVCMASGYVRADYEDERESGWYTNWAQPNEAERASAEYATLATKIADDAAYEQRQQQIIADRRQAELDAIRAEGREPTVFEDLFAGTSDN